MSDPLQEKSKIDVISYLLILYCEVSLTSETFNMISYSIDYLYREISYDK